MKYICVRIYGNGKFVNKIYPIYFEYYSQAENVCIDLNSYEDPFTEDCWIIMPIAAYVGEVWGKGNNNEQIH